MATAFSVSAAVSLVLLIINFQAPDALRLGPGEPKRSLLFGDRKGFIVYLGHVSHCKGGESTCPNLLAKAIDSLTGIAAATERIYQTYHHSFCGCAVKITDAEANVLRNINGVVSVFPDEKMELLTTRSWEAMGMGPGGVERNTEGESNTIVCVLDTGIIMESPSFDDKEMGPIPDKWKGTCDPTFKCNNKVIGAIDLASDPENPPSPRDTNGHGTHTASTAAGAIVPGASFFGIGNGTAQGGAPSARLAMYRVCSDIGCLSSSILLAFDVAPTHGCDILSVSLGGIRPSNYFTDAIAIGSYHANEMGVVTLAAAGNSGPGAGTATNVAPWLISVAACTMDRAIFTEYELGNGRRFKGVSINSESLGPRPLIYGGDAKDESSTLDSSECAVGSLNTELVDGKIVVCEGASTMGAYRAGADGALMISNTLLGVERVTPFPASQSDTFSGKRVVDYATNDSITEKTATIFKSISEILPTWNPAVASFSSRGPNLISGGILKPDLCAPGVAVLAAWPDDISPTTLDTDPRRVQYTFHSGTSMATPHVAGAAAYLKSFHPEWTPSIILSALTTTATKMDDPDIPSGVFGHGAGHINPTKAKDPGLVYDTSSTDYLVDLLCQQGIPELILQLVSGDPTFKCADVNTDLNYPTITFKSDSRGFNKTTIRTLTSVSSQPSTYKATVTTAFETISVKIEPDVLTFDSEGDEQSFEVTVNGLIQNEEGIVYAFLEWSDGIHQVRSPIVVYTNA